MAEIPDLADWSLSEIEGSDPRRATRLADAGAPSQLIAALVTVVEGALGSEDIRIGVDSIKNERREQRAIVQVKVDPDIYDWFFNARSSYRGQFWMSVEQGMDFNTQLTKAISSVLLKDLPTKVTARIIEVVKTDAGREDRDVGAMEVTSELLSQSLQSHEAKIWIGERLLQLDGQQPADIWFPVVAGAERDAKLAVPRWKSAQNPITQKIGSEGLLAPYPPFEYSWIDVKGGFVREDGTTKQLKDPLDRARMLHATGWT